MKKNKKMMIGTISAYLGFGLVAMVVIFNNHEIMGKGSVLYDLSGEVIESGKVNISEFNSVDTSQYLKETMPVEDSADDAADDDSDDSDSSSDKQYFKFTVATKANDLRIREEANLTAKVIGRMEKGVVGYVLEVGDGWSLVKYGDIIGYSSNKYLDIVQVAKEELPVDFPEEYK